MKSKRFLKKTGRKQKKSDKRNSNYFTLEFEHVSKFANRTTK